NDVLISEENPLEMKTSSGVLDRVINIACYNDVTYALRSDGTVWSAGNETASTGLATQLEGFSDIESLSMDQGELLFQKAGKKFYRLNGELYPRKKEGYKKF
ncbi:MAG: hypothetical protein ACH346_05075, partial [Chthoniobacterales bacterium]